MDISKNQWRSTGGMSNDLKWTYFANLTRLKWGVESVIVKNGLWLTGNVAKVYLKSSPV
jgi:hypothetical protein